MTVPQESDHSNNVDGYGTMSNGTVSPPRDIATPGGSITKETGNQTSQRIDTTDGSHLKRFIPQRDPMSGLVNQWHSQPRTIRIIHIGAGATGLCTAYKMRNKLQNYDLVCYEKNDSIGGTWFESMVQWKRVLTLCRYANIMGSQIHILAALVMCELMRSYLNRVCC